MLVRAYLIYTGKADLKIQEDRDDGGEDGPVPDEADPLDVMLVCSFDTVGIWWVYGHAGSV
jgi:hypothetical protein